MPQQHNSEVPTMTFPAERYREQYTVGFLSHLQLPRWVYHMGIRDLTR